MVIFCLVTEANSLQFSRQVWNSSFGCTWCNHVCEEALPKQVKITYQLICKLSRELSPLLGFSNFRFITDILNNFIVRVVCDKTRKKW